MSVLVAEEMRARVFGGMMSRRARRRSVRLSSSNGESVVSDMSEISESVVSNVRVWGGYDDAGGCTSVGVVVIVIVVEEDFAVEADGLFSVVLIFDFGELDHVCDEMEEDGI